MLLRTLRLPPDRTGLLIWTPLLFPQDFASTQHGTAPPQQAGAEQSDEQEQEEEDKGEPEVDEEAPAPHPDMPSAAEDPALDAPQSNVAPLTLDDVRSSEFGFGPNGVTVQPDGLHSCHLTDRAVLKQILLTGKPKITRKEACDKMRTARDTGTSRKALPKEKWTAAIAAAASQHPDIMRLDGETLCLKVIPDTSEGKVKYHNELMKACGLNLRDLVAAMQKQAVHRKPPRAE